MKKNFRSVMSTVFAALTALSATTGFTSCQDDNYETYQNESDNAPQQQTKPSSNLTFKEGLDVYPLIYTSYKTKYDVEITSTDTTTMSISAALLKSKNIELKEGNVISVWRSNTEMPFMRRITGVTQNGYNVDVTTKDVQASEIIENANLQFDSKVYVNPSVSATNGDGDLNPEHFVNSKDGVYHPVAIFMHSEEEDAKMKELGKQRDMLDGANSDTFGSDAEAVASSSDAIFSHEQKGEKKVYVISELEGSNFDLGISIEDSVKGVRFPVYVDKSGEKPDTVAWFGLKEAYGKVTGGIHASLDISWFSVKKFEIGPYYSIKGKVNPVLTASKTLPKWEKDYTIVETQGYTSVFWVGPVPVAISFKPSLGVNLQAGGKVEGTVGFNFEASGENHAYAVYENGGWHIDRGNGEFKHDFKPIFAGTIEAKAKATLYLKGEVMLYGVAGPTLKVGPYLEANAKASFNAVEGDIAAKASLKFGVGGKVGAQLKVWKWELQKWEQDFNLFEKEIWSDEWSLAKWRKESEKVAEETGHMTDEMRQVIEDEANRKYIDDVIDHTTEYKRFMRYMTAEPEQKASALNEVKEKYREEWQNIEKEHKAFYNWEREFQLWYGSNTHDDKLLGIVAGKIVEDTHNNYEFITNSRLSEKVLKIQMNIYITTGDESRFSTVKADKYESVMNDWKNIRAEYLRVKRTISPNDIDKMFVDPWFEKYSKDFTNN